MFSAIRTLLGGRKTYLFTAAFCIAVLAGWQPEPAGGVLPDAETMEKLLMAGAIASLRAAVAKVMARLG